MSESPNDPVARITIIGRPPEDGRPSPTVPRGIQSLLQMASEDERLKLALLDDRAATLSRCEVLLTESERRILSSIPRAQLEQMVGHLRVPQPERRQFLQQAAASVVALLAGAVLPGLALSGCSDSAPQATPTFRPTPGGIRTDTPTPAKTPEPMSLDENPHHPPFARGIRPDRPSRTPTPTGTPSETPSPSPSESPYPYPSPHMPPPPGGIRPDRP